MKKYILQLILLSLVLASCNEQGQNVVRVETASEPSKISHEVTFLTRDSVKVYADLYTANKTSPTILLFHQAGANARGEYGSIIPVLIENGFNVLAVDQRTGGQLFGQYNRTMTHFDLKTYNYCDAYPDLEAALNFVQREGYTGKIIAWGSSYSAALVIQLGARNKEISGVLAFSPASGDPMEGCNPDEYIKSIAVPLLVLRPSNEMEYESVKNQFAMAQEYNHETFIAKKGKHGSSMLVAARVKDNVAATWTKVLDFLGQFKAE